MTALAALLIAVDDLVKTVTTHGRAHRADHALRAWAANPANWCDRPACPRCYTWNGGTQ